MKKLLILVVLFNYFVLISSAIKPPHIVVIIGDDIGWNDFSFHGSNQIPTPNIDALGYNGVFLNKFYTQAICSPSRAAFLTGKYPMRYGYQGIPLGAGENRPFAQNIKLLPENLKKLGYQTHLVGKWHLNAARKSDTPTNRGFDSHFGYWNGFVGYFDYFAFQKITALNISTPLTGFDLYDGLKPQWKYQGKYATDVFTDKSLEIIDNHDANDPLFLYLAHLAAHAGSNGTELGVPNVTETETKFSYIEEPMRRRYADIVNQLDKSVGQVVAKLKEKGMLENSIILFFSDNGAQTVGLFKNFGSNYPFRGLKSTLLEGGVKGSAVLFSPLLEKKGYVNNHLMHITDLFSTFLDVAGGQPEVHETHDGISQWNSISENAASLRSEILLNIDEKNGFSGLISDFGRYKYLNGSYLNGIYDGAHGDTGRNQKVPNYDIKAVIQSKVNQAIQKLSDSSPLTSNIIKSLRAQLDASNCNGKVRTEDLPCTGECLFDLWDDPCETNNIVRKKPLVRALMRAKLKGYIKQIVPSKNTLVDLNSNPKYCNNTWFPWLDQDGCYTGLTDLITN